MKWLLGFASTPFLSLAICWAIGRAAGQPNAEWVEKWNRRANTLRMEQETAVSHGIHLAMEQEMSVSHTQVVWCDSCNRRAADGYRDIDGVRYFICRHCTIRPVAVQGEVIRRAIGQ